MFFRHTERGIVFVSLMQADAANQTCALPAKVSGDGRWASRVVAPDRNGTLVHVGANAVGREKAPRAGKQVGEGLLAKLDTW